MTWKEKTIARVLLILARMLADDVLLRDELKHLGNHITASPTASTPPGVTDGDPA